MRIAILGTRGIPANYGGFETFAEALSVHLAERGHDVTVYGRSNFITTKEPVYQGVRLVVLPTIRHKYLDTPAHTALSTAHALFRPFDVLLFCNSANSFCTLAPRLTGKKVALNVDGLEWKRAKWSAFGSAVYRVSEFLATFLPDVVVTDARDVQQYYWRTFRKSSTWIPYGSPVGKVESQDALRQFGIQSRQYVLYVSRLEPENNAHVVIRAFEDVKTDMPLVVVGDAPYSQDYIRKLKATRDPRILFTGYVFKKGYRELQSHASCYVQATEVGGTHPALVEAMGHGNCVVANDVPEHREVLGDAGCYFRVSHPESLTEVLQRLLDHPGEMDVFRKKAETRVRQRYTWERVTDAYEALFRKMVRR